MSKPDPDAAGDRPASARTPVTRYNYHSLVDLRFAEAEAEGLFDNLPGQGRPQKLDDDSLVPEEYRAGFRLLKGSGFAPPWIAACRDIGDERTKLDAWLAGANERWPRLDEAARAAIRVEYRRKLEHLQRMILTYNLTAPPAAGHFEGLRLQEELRKLGC
jgi:DnaJ family protein C protein 28